MATNCPDCEMTVRPVVTTRDDCDPDDDDADCLDREQGYHCPECGYKFADADEVFTDEYSR